MYTQDNRFDKHAAQWLCSQWKEWKYKQFTAFITQDSYNYNEKLQKPIGLCNNTKNVQLQRTLNSPEIICAGSACIVWQFQN